MRCVILQPSYIPWRGYFHQIHEADVFVFYDDVQHDKRGWRNRNRIRGPNGSFWLTIPIKSKGLRSQGTKINEVEIDWHQAWNQKHFKSLTASYEKAPFFGQYRDLLSRFYSRKDRLLVDFVIDFTQVLAAELGIDNTTFLRSSALSVAGERSERLIEIVRRIGADHYITGPSARSYLNERLFEEAGVDVEYFRYDYPEYPQLFDGFDPHVSILDLLFMQGPAAPRFIWQRESP